MTYTRSLSSVTPLTARRSWWIALGLGVGVIAAPASAGVSAKLLRNDISFSVRGSEAFAPFDQGGSLIDVSRGNNGANGLTFEALSDLGESSILFKNSIIGTGAGTRMRATIGVEITLENDFGFDFKPVLRTKLLAAGMGVFLAAPMQDKFPPGVGMPQAPSTLDCTAYQLKNCAPVTEARIAGLFDSPAEIFGRTSTGFDFNVTVDGASKYRMQASIGYDRNGNEFANVGQAKALTNFGRSDTDDQIFTTAYSWDDTFVDITLGTMLRQGESITAIYTISTFIDIGSGSGQLIQFIPVNGGGETLVLTPGAFAAFGDPIGGSGTIDEFMQGQLSASRLFGGESLLTETAETGPLRINTNGTGIFDLPFIMQNPATGTPTLIFDARTDVMQPDVRPYDPVPEPSAWAMLIAGFGAIGTSMRRRLHLANRVRRA